LHTYLTIMLAKPNTNGVLGGSRSNTSTTTQNKMVCFATAGSKQGGEGGKGRVRTRRSQLLCCSSAQVTQPLQQQHESTISMKARKALFARAENKVGLDNGRFVATGGGIENSQKKHLRHTVNLCLHTLATLTGRG